MALDDPAVAVRTVRVRTEVAALEKTFDYAVPGAWPHDVRVGTRLRVPLHGRTVRGWVVDDDVVPPEGVDVQPAKSWLGWGPPPDVVSLAEWAAWRWAGPVAFFLHTASPPAIVRALPRPPTPPPRRPPPPAVDRTGPAEADGGTLGVAGLPDLGRGGPSALRLPPSTDLLDLVRAVLDAPAVRARPGTTLVLVPSTGWAERLRSRLVRRGYAVAGSWDEARAGWPVVVGSRSAAWAPVPRLAAVVVLDAHDAAYHEESAPTYSAVEVVLERARREDVPCLVVSPVPPVSLAARLGAPLAPPAPLERAGWPALESVDRRGADPRSGLFSEEFVRLAHGVLDSVGRGDDGPLVCVYNRKGGIRLSACARCGELARCTRCGGAVVRAAGVEELRCPRCGVTRPVVCVACGGLRMKVLRPGVSRLRDELAALLRVDVGEVAGPASGVAGSSLPRTPVLVGTEAVLHRVRRAAAVAFLDVDQHLLAPRLSATEESLALLVRAGRLVGPRGAAGAASRRVQVQTRVPTHPVLEAVAGGQPATVLANELDLRRQAGLPPFVALALVSGVHSGAFTEALRRTQAADGSAVTLTTLGESRVLLQAATHEGLCDLLARTPRPPGRGLRVEVDPATL